MAQQQKPPRWKVHQTVAGYICLILAMVYFTVQQVSKPLWGLELDFGWMAAALFYIGALVVFNVKIPNWLRYLASIIAKENDRENKEG
jgi:hypothetical protein